MEQDKGAVLTGTWLEYDVGHLMLGGGTYTFTVQSTSSDGHGDLGDPKRWTRRSAFPDMMPAGEARRFRRGAIHRAAGKIFWETSTSAHLYAPGRPPNPRPVAGRPPVHR
jgi:hypothetical protein